MKLLDTFNTEPHITFEQQNKVGILLMNLGTPERPTPESLSPYLRRFLSDRRVVELPGFFWKPLLRFAVIPLRAKHVAENYGRVWLNEGSPLKVFTERQCEGLRQRLPDNIYIEYAMSYSEPFASQALAKLKANGVGRVLVLPLYPQYAASSTGAAVDKVLNVLLKQRNQMSLRTVSRFYDHEGYIKALAAQIRNYRAEHGAGEMLMFSFHGIPQMQHDKGDPYPHECRKTAQLVAAELGLGEQDYTVSFQSQFGKGQWLKPSTQDLFVSLPKKDKIKKLDVVCPGFVSDCLETMEEIAIAGREEFFANGGEQFHYIPCLNDHPLWLDALADLAKDNLQGWVSYSL